MQTRKPALLGGLDPVDRRVEDPFALDGDVVVFPHAIQVHVEKEGPARREVGELLADEHPVGAEDDDLLPLLNLGHQLADARVDHRLATADRDDGRTALVDGGQAFVDRQLLLDRRFVFANSPAAGARQVAGVQRFEHENHGELLGSRQFACGRHSRRCGWSSAVEKASGGASLAFAGRVGNCHRISER